MTVKKSFTKNDNVPVAEFVDFVEDSDCKDDSIADGDAAFPFGWDGVEASCGADREDRGVHGVDHEDHGEDHEVHEVDHEVHILVEAYPASYPLVPYLVAYPVAYLLVP